MKVFQTQMRAPFFKYNVIMDWHAYKYLVKTVHRLFFPIMALLENDMPQEGQKALAQRKLLYLEKLFAALLLGSGKFRNQLDDRVKSVEAELLVMDQSSGHVDPDERRRLKTLLTILVSLKTLLDFYLPAVFRVGYLVRCCTWEGRQANSSDRARKVLEEVLMLLVHLLQDDDCKNEYVRTISVTLLMWQPWNSKLPACSYMEESCEALLSRMGHRCSTHRHLSGFESTMDLYLTLPPPQRKLKATRGMISEVLIQMFVTRIRGLVYSNGVLPYAAAVGARQMHSEFAASFPDGVTFRGPLTAISNAASLERVLHRALLCLTSKGRISVDVENWLSDNVRKRSPEDRAACRRSMEQLKNALNNNKKKEKVPRPVRFAPKPRAKTSPDIYDFSIQ